MFEKEDYMGTGLLTYEQFIHSFSRLTYNLDEDDIKIMVALADEDENEKIPWRPFIPTAIRIIRTIYKRDLTGKKADLSPDSFTQLL